MFRNMDCAPQCGRVDVTGCYHFVGDDKRDIAPKNKLQIIERQNCSAEYSIQPAGEGTTKQIETVYTLHASADSCSLVPPFERICFQKGMAFLFDSCQPTICAWPRAVCVEIWWSSCMGDKPNRPHCWATVGRLVLVAVRAEALVQTGG